LITALIGGELLVEVTLGGRVAGVDVAEIALGIKGGDRSLSSISSLTAGWPPPRSGCAD